MRSDMRTELMSDPFWAGDADPEETPEDLTERLAELLRPAVNLMARRIYAEHGYVVSEDYDFSLATHPQERAAFRSAVGAIEVLEDFLRDTQGTSLFDLCDSDSLDIIDSAASVAEE